MEKLVSLMSLNECARRFFLYVNLIQGDKMNEKRPVNLALTTIKFPPMAIVSILHRLSGLFLFILIPILLCVLESSLASESSFAKVSVYFSSAMGKFFVWLTICALIYHLLAGFRHMLMDLGWGEHVNTARTSALLLLVVVVIIGVVLGAWLW